MFSLLSPSKLDTGIGNDIVSGDSRLSNNLHPVYFCVCVFVSLCACVCACLAVSVSPCVSASMCTVLSVCSSASFIWFFQLPRYLVRLSDSIPSPFIASVLIFRPACRSHWELQKRTCSAAPLATSTSDIDERPFGQQHLPPNGISTIATTWIPTATTATTIASIATTPTTTSSYYLALLLKIFVDTCSAAPHLPLSYRWCRIANNQSFKAM